MAAYAERSACRGWRDSGLGGRCFLEAFSAHLTGYGLAIVAFGHEVRGRGRAALSYLEPLASCAFWAFLGVLLVQFSESWPVGPVHSAI